MLENDSLSGVGLNSVRSVVHCDYLKYAVSYASGRLCFLKGSPSARNNSKRDLHNHSSDSDDSISPFPPISSYSTAHRSKRPIGGRAPTDMAFLIVFCGAWLMLLIVVSPSVKSYSPLRLISGIDWQGRTCGYDSGVEHLPYVYWPAKQMPQKPSPSELPPWDIIPVGNCTSASPPGRISFEYRLQMYSLVWFCLVECKPYTGLY